MATDKAPKDLAHQLDDAVSDQLTQTMKAIASAVPVAGGLLSELVGSIIPNQRIDRIARFCKELEARIGHLERGSVVATLENEHFADLFEDTVRAASRSLSDERRGYLASIISHSLSPAEIEYVESKSLLKFLNELSDIDVIWLQSYSEMVRSSGLEFQARHEHILSPIAAHLGSDRQTIDSSTLQSAHKEHLARLGLLEVRYKVDSRTKVPVFRNGVQEIQGYRITSLGQLLLRNIGLASAE